MPPATDPTLSSRRVGTVDIGTNSVRLLIAEAFSDGTYRLLDDEKVVSRLGRGTSGQRALSPEAMQETADAIGHMKHIADGYQVDQLRAVATCAVREAPNREDFLELVRETASIEVEVLSGEAEARLAWRSVRNAFDVRHRDLAVVDIGGGSTEIVVAAGGIIEKLASLSLGAVRLTEQIPESSATVHQRLESMRREIREEFLAHLRKPATRPQSVIGTGGTFTTLAMIDQLRRTGHEKPASGGNIRGYELTRAEVCHWCENLAAMTPEQRRRVPGLPEDRAEIIVAGLCIAEVVMQRLGASRLQIHDRGIRDGVLLAMTHSLFPKTVDLDPDEPPQRMAEIRRFARKCRYERVHSEHVADLALCIHDQLCSEGLIQPEHRDLLEAAAILHDIGYYINYAKHHRHSYHLIVHADIRGFSHHELELIALIARYHRRAHPKPKHAEFAVLQPSDRMTVRRLAAILRIADGLDRTHSGNVQGVRVHVETTGVHFGVVAEHSPDVALWGADRKSRLFAKVFGLTPVFEWVAPTDPDSGGSEPEGETT